MEHPSSPARRSLRAAFWTALILCLPHAARAATATVDCTGATPGAFTSINSALLTLDNVGPHAVTVTGPCTESVNIQQRDRLTIQSAPPNTAVISAPAPGANVLAVGGSHNVTLRGLVLRGGGNGLQITRGSTVTVQGVSLTENTGNGLRVDTGSVVSLSGAPPFPPVVISDNGGAGISADASVLSVNGGLTVEDNEGFALTVVGGRLTVNGGASENVFRDNGGGINLDGAVSTFSGRNSIQNNGSSGVQVTGGRASFNGSVVADVPRVTTIEGHTLGVNVAAGGSASFNGPNRIRNNGGGNPDADFRGGVRIGTVSRVQFDGANEITGNIGYGVFLDFNGALAMNDAVVTNNTEGGVRVARSSVGDFGLGNAFAGNGGAQISCDDTSLISGPGLAGLDNKAIACKNIEHEKGPSRPGVPK
jgi:hypothetical protein